MPLVISKRRKPVRTPLGVIQKAAPRRGALGKAEQEAEDLRKFKAAEEATVLWLDQTYHVLGLTPNELHETVLSYLSNGQLNPLLDALNWIDFGRQFNDLAGRMAGINYVRAKDTVDKYFGEKGVLNGNLYAGAVLSGVVTTGDLRTTLATIDSQAVRWAQDNSAKLVTNISAEIRQNINFLVTESMSGDFTVNSLARQIKMIVPLTDRYTTAVLTRQNSLLDGFLKGGMKLADAQEKALSMSETYADKLTRSRALTIARTEVMGAAGEGRLNAWGAMMIQGIIPQDAQKVWMTAEDERVCPICGDLDGETVPMGSEFSVGVMTIPAHPNCRCDVSYLPSPTPDGNPYDQGNPDGSPVSEDAPVVDSTDEEPVDE